MRQSRRGPASDFDVVVRWLAVLWLVFAIDVAIRVVFHVFIAEWLGLRPGRLSGLIGIPCAPFLHADLAHILSNSIGLLVLGWVACGYSRRLTAAAVGYAMVVSGTFTWVIGMWTRPDSIHIGASGVVFGLIGFLIANGLVRRGCFPLFLGAATLLLFGGALPALLPTAAAAPVQLSWEMHLGGFIGGIIASWQLRTERVR